MSSDDPVSRSLASYSQNVVVSIQANTQQHMLAAPTPVDARSRQGFILPALRDSYSMPSYSGDNYAISTNTSIPSISSFTDRYPGQSPTIDPQSSRDSGHTSFSMPTDDRGSENSSQPGSSAFQRHPFVSETQPYSSNRDSQLVADPSPPLVEHVAKPMQHLLDYGRTLREHHMQVQQQRRALQDSQDVFLNGTSPSPFFRLSQEKSAVSNLTAPPEVIHGRQARIPKLSKPSFYQNHEITTNLEIYDTQRPNNLQNAVKSPTHDLHHSVLMSPSIPMCNPDTHPSHLPFHGNCDTSLSVHTHPSQFCKATSSNSFFADASHKHTISQTMPIVSTQDSLMSSFHAPQFSAHSKGSSQGPELHDFSIVAHRSPLLSSKSSPVEESVGDLGTLKLDDPSSPSTNNAMELPAQTGGHLSIKLVELDERLDEVEDLSRHYGKSSTRKKKSKMHECPVCSKSFPRPSGLKTHMNIHNNARPYACGFPGCPRTFGVQSNAKRHLKTHGVIPMPAQSPPEESYVVDFSDPVIVPPPEHLLTGNSGTQQEHIADDVEGGEEGEKAGFPGNGGWQGQRSSSQVPAFKVRWLSPQIKQSDEEALWNLQGNHSAESAQHSTGSGKGASTSSGLCLSDVGHSPRLASFGPSDSDANSLTMSSSTYIAAPLISSSMTHSVYTSSASTISPAPFIKKPRRGTTSSDQTQFEHLRSLRRHSHPYLHPVSNMRHTSQYTKEPRH